MVIPSYEATLIIGHVGAIVAILGGYFRLHASVMKKIVALNSRFTEFMVEHEILVDFVCKQSGIKREDLPTRHHTRWSE